MIESLMDALNRIFDSKHSTSVWRFGITLLVLIVIGLLVSARTVVKAVVPIVVENTIANSPSVAKAAAAATEAKAAAAVANQKPDQIISTQGKMVEALSVLTDRQQSVLQSLSAIHENGQSVERRLTRIEAKQDAGKL